MEFEITTNHEMALAIKRTLESKVLKFTETKGLSLKKITVSTGYAVVTVSAAPGAKTSAVYFLGTHSELQSNLNKDVKFGNMGLLSLDEAKALLDPAPVSSGHAYSE